VTPGAGSDGVSSPGGTTRGDGVADDAVLGYVEVLAAATLWGSSGIFAVFLFRHGLTPESVALLRPLVGVVFLGLLLAVTAPGRGLPDRRGLLFLAGLGGGLTAVFQLAYQMAVESVGVPTTVALLRALPERERSKVRFIHLNHTNPAHDPGSAACREVARAGMRLAERAERFDLAAR